MGTTDKLKELDRYVTGAWVDGYAAITAQPDQEAYLFPIMNYAMFNALYLQFRTLADVAYKELGATPPPLLGVDTLADPTTNPNVRQILLWGELETNTASVAPVQGLGEPVTLTSVALCLAAIAALLGVAYLFYARYTQVQAATQLSKIDPRAAVAALGGIINGTVADLTGANVVVDYAIKALALWGGIDLTIRVMKGVSGK